MPDLIRHPEALKILDSRLRGNDVKLKIEFLTFSKTINNRLIYERL